ncbi:MAG: hypothetical protein ACO1OQ_12815 [Rufibacter sp.]
MTEQEIKEQLLQLTPEIEYEQVDENNRRETKRTYENELALLVFITRYQFGVESDGWMAQLGVDEFFNIK